MRFVGGAVALLLALSSSFSQPRTLDDFESTDRWRVITTENVEAQISVEPGLKGNALRVDYNFKGGGGYFILQRDLSIDVPDDYAITFFSRGKALSNNLEFKFLDSTGENVWWHFRRAFEFPEQWTKLTTRPRHIVFAWGPSGGGTLRNAHTIEFAISAVRGGSGTLWFDDLQIEERKPLTQYPRPRAFAAPAFRAALESRIRIDSVSVAVAPLTTDDTSNALLIDLGVKREIGGITLRWSKSATEYDLLLSDDGQSWRDGASVRNGNGGIDNIPLPEADIRFLKIVLLQKQSAPLADITIRSVEFSSSLNSFFFDVASQNPRGWYPRAFLREQSYWTVAGVADDSKEALMNEEGLIEIDKESPSFEPFLFSKGKLVTWNEVVRTQSLADGYLPLPSVRWSCENLNLDITPLAWGESGKSTLAIRYRLANIGSSREWGTLFITLRPFQVNPPWQDLNTVGGAAKVRTLAWKKSELIINDSHRATFVPSPSKTGCTPFLSGEIVEYISTGNVPNRPETTDPLSAASAGAGYDYSLQPGETMSVTVTIPLSGAETQSPAYAVTDKDFVRLFESARSDWRKRLSGFDIRIPGADSLLTNLIRTTLGYILINKDGPGIQPGSRVYERSWIRDGSLTGSALLAAGERNEMKGFLEWYAPYQFTSGKVPCVVDSRGADPVPENDSHGQLIAGIYDYYRFTKDTASLRSLYPHVLGAATYIDTLRRRRMTDEYRTDEKKEFFGILPESISHEGYSAKPMHSYWDDFFAARGLRDAAEISRVLSDTVNWLRLDSMAAEFTRNLKSSISTAIRRHSLTYVPGCAELGDFDATSTAIAVNIGLDTAAFPAREYEKTFDRYMEFFHGRASGKEPWVNFTPYEFRIVNALVRLGKIEPAHEVLEWLLQFRRPTAWNHWAEVVWKNPTTPRMIGDMPHTWCGTEFILAVRSLFVYESDDDRSLIIARGLKQKWLDEGVSILNVPTRCGTLSYSVKRISPQEIVIPLEGALDPNTHIFVPARIDKRTPREITINDVPARADTFVRIDTLPAVVRFRY